MPDLDTDVIETFCGLVDDIHDLLSVSLTCSVLWRIAIRQLLRTHTIHLKSRKAIRGFRLFILNQKPTRAHHIHSLVIPQIAWTRTTGRIDDVGQLMDILDCAVNLHSLDLSLDAYHVEPGRASSAFAGMVALRHLSLADPDLRWAHEALNALRSPPVTLCLMLATHLNQTFSSPSILTSIHLDWVSFSRNNSFLSLPQFRSVRSVIITQVKHEPRLEPLLHLFPCLEGTLRLRITAPKNMIRFASPARLAGIQEENKRTQEVSHWARLDRLDCESTTAFMLALQCPVRHLTIDRFDTPLLANIRMQHLVVTDIHFPQDLGAALKGCTRTALSLAGGPTHVVLIVRYEAEDYALNNERPNRPIPRRNENTVFESAVQALASFPHLTHARLVFHCSKEYSFKDDLDLDEYDFVHQMRECASISPPSPPALAAACPTLRYLVVTAAGRDETQPDIAPHGRWLRTRAWRVVLLVEGDGCRRGADTDGELEEPAPRMLEELSHYAVGRLIEDEDMGLPEEWETITVFLLSLALYLLTCSNLKLARYLDKEVVTTVTRKTEVSSQSAA
ncbi:hypothetical protein LXA43DRAFT_1085599 [Ganoderma leucocontextum]|nr:hypothetical protein LXA43DRAFT_1085599 [Ganoderma leucocontextum]